MKFIQLIIALGCYILCTFLKEVGDVSRSSVTKLFENGTIGEETAKELLEYKDSRRVSVSKKKEEKTMN